MRKWQTETQRSGSGPDGIKKHAEEASEARKVEDHISQLRDELAITTAEEPQWDRVAKTMRENAEEIDQATDKRDATINTATAVENLILMPMSCRLMQLRSKSSQTRFGAVRRDVGLSEKDGRRNLQLIASCRRRRQRLRFQPAHRRSNEGISL